jgi:hypothetical protein
MAIAVMIAAGFLIDHRQAGQPSQLPPSRPEPTATATVYPRVANLEPTTVNREAAVARAYTLAATNWTSRTYAAAQRRQADLAGGALRRALLRPPAAAQLGQLRTDRVVQLGAIVRTRRANPTAAVLVDVDELSLSAGQRQRQTVRYQVVVHRSRDGLQVVAFGAVRSDGSM